MDDEDEIQSNGRITVTLAASAPPLSSPSRQQESPQRKNNNNNNSSAQTLTPVPSQQQKQPKSGGGWREDCWSEGATEVLIDAWGERYLELSRGNLKQKHWQEVADIVTSRDDYSKPAKSDVQCKNRIDTVKKKYKQEKAKVVAGGGPSKWPFYQQLDRLIGKHTKVTPLVSPAGGGGGGGSGSGRVPVGIPVGRAGGSSNRAGKQSKSNQNAGMQFRKRWMMESESDEEEEEEERFLDSDDDSLPPPKRARRGPMVVQREVNRKGGGGKERKAGSGSSIRMLTLAILKFGEAYEHAETAKLQQVVEMEKARMKFAKELELQRMQFFVKTQMEISRLKEQGRKGGSNGSNHHGTGGIHNNNSNNANNNSNNSDSDN